MQHSVPMRHSAAAASCRDTSTAAALAAAGVECSQGIAFDVGTGPSMLQTALQRPGPLRELLAFGNTQQQQQQRPRPPPRPLHLRPEAQQAQLRAHADDIVMHPAAASAEPRQPPVPASCNTVSADIALTARLDASAAGPPEVSMCEAGGRAMSPDIYSVAQHNNGASGELAMPRPAANGGQSLPSGDNTAAVACSAQCW